MKSASLRALLKISYFSCHFAELRETCKELTVPFGNHQIRHFCSRLYWSVNITGFCFDFCSTVYETGLPVRLLCTHRHYAFMKHTFLISFPGVYLPFLVKFSVGFTIGHLCTFLALIKHLCPEHLCMVLAESLHCYHGEN